MLLTLAQIKTCITVCVLLFALTAGAAIVSADRTPGAQGKWYPANPSTTSQTNWPALALLAGTFSGGGGSGPAVATIQGATINGKFIGRVQ